MIFRISREYLESGAIKDVDLILFLRCASIRHHTVDVYSDATPEIFGSLDYLAAWAERLVAPLSDEVTLLLEYVKHVRVGAVSRGTVTCIVTGRALVERKSVDVVLDLSFDQARLLIQSPLYVLVENALSDGEFLRRCLPNSWRQKLVEWEEQGMVSFENGGGVGEIFRTVKHRSKDSEAMRIWAAAHVIISDRDSEDLAGKPSETVRRLQRLCDVCGLSRKLHVLERRDQESYIPEKALRILISERSGEDAVVMAAKLDDHYSHGVACHKQLPRLGEKSWFKNVFFDRSTDMAWNDDWFREDGSGNEMVAVAELIAANI